MRARALWGAVCVVQHSPRTAPAQPQTRVDSLCRGCACAVLGQSCAQAVQRSRSSCAGPLRMRGLGCALPVHGPCTGAVHQLQRPCTGCVFTGPCLAVHELRTRGGWTVPGPHLGSVRALLVRGSLTPQSVWPRVSIFDATSPCTFPLCFPFFHRSSTVAKLLMWPGGVSRHTCRSCLASQLSLVGHQPRGMCQSVISASVTPEAQYEPAAFWVCWVFTSGGGGGGGQ